MRGKEKEMKQRKEKKKGKKMGRALSNIIIY